jgi:hypothetical protein
MDHLHHSNPGNVMGSPLLTTLGGFVWAAGTASGQAALQWLGPILVGAAGLWQASIAHERLRLDRARHAADAASKAKPRDTP